jgi:hypothetical protein
MKTRRKKIKSKRKTSKYQKIADQLQSISRSSIEKEYTKLRAFSCNKALKASGRARLGNKIVDAFTFVERLHTKGHQNVSFYEFWENREKYKKKPYIQKMLTFYRNRKIDEIRKFKYIYNLYFSSIAIFRPVMAMEVYCRVKAKRVLDFTMGWGGRLVGACALGLDAYYGIDANTNLRQPYKELVSFLENEDGHKTKIDVRFQDALTVDYSKIDYDCVFTSPPYYDLESYRGSEGKYKTKEHWNDHFYKPLFRKTFDAMKRGGAYCLNVPEEIYQAACVPELGKCKKKIPLKKGERKPGKDEYRDFVYIW